MPKALGFRWRRAFVIVTLLIFNSPSLAQVKVKLENDSRPRLSVQAALSSLEIIEIEESDDSDDIQIYDNADISLVVKDRKVGLKQQHPRVEKTMQVGIDYYLSYYLFKTAFPSTGEKNNFSADALVNGAHQLGFEDVKARLLRDEKYLELAGSVLHARVSSFRLKAKTAADMTVGSSYGLRGNTEDRVAWLIQGMRYLYPLTPGGIDPRTAKPGPEIVNNTRGFLSEGITMVISQAFFKGTPSIASKYAHLFVTNENGNKEVPAAMAALGGTAVHASLTEHRSGHHVPSKFEGNTLQEIYDTQLLLLEKLSDAGSPVLELLYTSVTEGNGLGNVAKKPMAMEALAILGL
ncbi:hypothetical protein B0H17DRAFT_1215675 [Mycena rosella]|uniref:DUF6532 domain-containing protein n=1 Tax=Mycena rosella TaxID=1033263 RepID=A0AAD7CHB6_MYCRO|nr:hypothetical protein B0H17DRAFT_1215675 [Mycena rosella]